MPMPESDVRLKARMLEALDGDSSAHAALLRVLVPLLQSFYRRRLHGSEEDVQDLLHETLISVHTRRASYDRDRPFTAWLYAVARYRMIDHFRRQKGVGANRGCGRYPRCRGVRGGGACLPGR
jgi:DNA-directed RNA polymerase specialized sigma24 family protein